MRAANAYLAVVVWGFFGISCGAASYCIGDGDCPDSAPICVSSNGVGQCTACTMDAQCQTARGTRPGALQAQPLCEVATGQCRHCLTATATTQQRGCPGSGDAADLMVCAPRPNSTDTECVSKAQLECVADADCGLATGAKAFCVANRCVACDAPGLSAEQTCGKRSAGLAPVCKASVCSPCASDSLTECPETGLCIKAGDPVKGSLKDGQCISNSDFATVISSAELDAALTAKRTFIKLMPGTGTSYTTMATVTSDTMIVGGAQGGRDAASWGDIRNSDATRFNGVRTIQVNNGAKLVLRSVQIRSLPANPAIKCDGNASVYAYDTRIRGLTRGIDAEMNCSKVTVERSWLTAGGNALRIGYSGNSTYRIVNNAIVETGGAEPDAVALGGMANGYFGFNTLKDNFNGVLCNSTVKQPISESIVAGSLGTAVTNCTEGVGIIKTLSSMNDLGPVTDPKLLDNAATQACCINKGAQPNPAITDDFYSTARTTAPDRGFHELR